MAATPDPSSAQPVSSHPPGASPAATGRKDRRLGRGLASLITVPVTSAPDSVSGEAQTVGGPATPAGTPAASAGHPAEHTMVLNLDPANVTPNPHQPRQEFDPDGLARLAESIKVNGLVQPILVRRCPAPPSGPEQPRFQLIAGERRWRAARLAGLASLPAIVKAAADDAMLELALVENIHRADLNPVERAVGYQAMMRQRDLLQEQLAQRLGESRATVGNHLRLLEMPEEVQQFVASGQLSFGHAKALMGLRRAENQIKLARAVVKDDWSVREVERLVSFVISSPAGEQAGPSMIEDAATARQTGRRQQADPPPKPANILALEEKLTRRLGTRVAIKQGRRADMGKVLIDFYCLDDFDRILEALGVAAD